MIESNLQAGGTVAFPENRGERIYMLPFFQREGLPWRLSRWQATVDAMLIGVRTEGPIYLMVDQGVVGAGQTQRRSGLHIEMNWDAANQYHAPRHRPASIPEMVILASDVGGCRAFVGILEGTPGPEGQCDHIDLSGAREVVFHAGRAYRGTVTTVHEALPIAVRTQRTVVRLNLPGAQSER